MNIRVLQVGDQVAGHTITHLVDSNSGFGNVYKARHNRLNADHAIKQLRPDRLPYRQTFIEEARRAKQINNPHVVNIHDLIESDRLYGDIIIMDWIEGETLLKWRHHNDTITPLKLIPIAQGIAEGLAAVHLIFSHNDIKPDNIMIRTDMHPVLIDFGLAYHDMDGGTHPVNRGAKTAAFAAPEVLQNKPLQNEERILSDIFSLGVVYYYLFTGRHYLNMSMSQIANHSDTQFVLNNLAHQRPHPIQNCPPTLNALIMQMLNPIPAQRPPSLNAIMQQLDAIANEEHQIIQTQHQQSIANVPQIYVGIPDTMTINTQALPMNAVKVTSERLLYQAPIAPSPLSDVLLLAVQYEQNLYAANIRNPGKVEALYFGHDAKGNLQLMYDDEVLPTLPTRPIIPAQVRLTRQCKTQVAFILDARLVGQGLEIATYIIRMVQQAAENDYELDVAIVLYGAYPELKDSAQSSWRSPYFLQAQDFRPYHDAVRFAEYYLFENEADFSGIGYSGALEVALHHTLHNLSWDATNPRYALILGHSVPYPTPEERRHHDLFEFSIDEFTVKPDVVNWRKTREQMRQHHITMNAAYIDPPYGISQAYKTFMEQAWRTLDEENHYHRLQDSYTVEEFSLLVISTLKRIKRVVHQPQTPYPLPLTKPLT